MAVRIDYTSTEATTPEVCDAIRVDLEHSQSDHSWILCEPPHFYPTEGDGKLRGSSKLILHPSEDEWEVGDRDHQERNELQELLRWLCRWSEEHDLIWELSVAGTPFGRIVRGTCLANLERQSEARADATGYLTETGCPVCLVREC